MARRRFRTDTESGGNIVGRSIHCVAPDGVATSTGVWAFFATADIGCHDRLASDTERERLESSLSMALRRTGLTALGRAVVRIHTIKDVGKTERRVRVRTDDGGLAKLGRSSHRVLIGVFLENRHLSMDALSADIVENPVVQRAVAGVPLGVSRLCRGRRACMLRRWGSWNDGRLE